MRKETRGEERRGERCREIVERGEEEIVREERGKEGTGEEKEERERELYISSCAAKKVLP